MILLEQQLEREDPELFKKLGDVKRAAELIWKEPQLTWFTDHGLTHSQRVIAALNKIVEPLQPSPQRLSAAEIYILLSATYLHDIGMQDMVVDGRPRDQLTPRDYEAIRKRHPRRSADLIQQRTVQGGRGQVQVGIDDSVPGYAIAIANTALGHGTEYYEEAVLNAQSMMLNLGGQSVRGDLLAALLLMADELDLHEERARVPREADLSALSTLHHMVNLYITAVAVRAGDTPKDRVISVSFQYPADSVEYGAQIREWIVGKLRRQMELTRRVLKIGTAGEMAWADYVVVRETIDKTTLRPPLPQGAVAELKRELVERRTLIPKTVTAALKQRVVTVPGYCALCIVSPDDLARSEVVKWLDAQCASRGLAMIGIGLKDTLFTRAEVALRIFDALGGGDEAQGRRKTYENTTGGKALRDMLVKDLRLIAARKAIVLLFQEVDAALDTRVRSWIEKDLLGALSAGHVPLKVVVTRSEMPAGSEPTHYERVDLGSLTEADLVEVFRRTHGYGDEEARSRAQEMIAATGGRLVNLLSWFEQVRAKGWRLEA
jgi:hypothetical protein